jgi:hypothetical protein
MGLPAFLLSSKTSQRKCAGVRLFWPRAPKAIGAAMGRLPGGDALVSCMLIHNKQPKTSIAVAYVLLP